LNGVQCSPSSSLRSTPLSPPENKAREVESKTIGPIGLGDDMNDHFEPPSVVLRSPGLEGNFAVRDATQTVDDETGSTTIVL
jgi:hypothetical protein